MPAARPGGRQTLSGSSRHHPRKYSRAEAVGHSSCSVILAKLATSLFALAGDTRTSKGSLSGKFIISNTSSLPTAYNASTNKALRRSTCLAIGFLTRSANSGYSFRTKPAAWYSSRMAGWSSKLTRPVAIRGGPILRTLNDVRAFLIDRLPPEDRDRQSWQLTVELLLAAADGSAEIEVATQQLERALFLQAKWVMPEDR